MRLKKRPEKAEYPALVNVAGVIWLIIAVALTGLGVISLAMLLTLDRSPANLGLLLVSHVVVIGAGALFLVMGIELCRGSGKSTIVPGSVGFLVGVLLCLLGIYIYLQTNDLDRNRMPTERAIITMALLFILGLSLVATGLAVYFSRAAFDKWLQYKDCLDNPQEHQPAGPDDDDRNDRRARGCDEDDDDRPRRRPRQDAADDDYDDRPRRRPRYEDEDDRPRRRR